MGYTIGPVRDDTALMALLESDPYTSAYALSDLDPPYRENARYIGATQGEDLKAALLLYSLPSTTALNVFGDVEAAAAIFDAYDDLPQQAFLILSPEHMSVVDTRYSR